MNCTALCPRSHCISVSHTSESVESVGSTCQAGGERLDYRPLGFFPGASFPFHKKSIFNPCFPNCILKRPRFPARALLWHLGARRTGGQGSGSPTLFQNSFTFPVLSNGIHSKMSFANKMCSSNVFEKPQDLCVS